jgi:hypothetical protein
MERLCVNDMAELQFISCSHDGAEDVFGTGVMDGELACGSFKVGQVGVDAGVDDDAVGGKLLVVSESFAHVVAGGVLPAVSNA